MKFLSLLSFVSASGIDVTDSNWLQIMQGEWMLEFSAPWCPACQRFEPEWNKLGDWAAELGISVGNVDITHDHSLAGRFVITSLPTVFHCLEGSCTLYEGGRTFDALHEYVSDKKYEQQEPLPWYRQPSSFTMSIVSWLFLFSSYMQITHDYLTQEMGFSNTISYVIYGVCTILTGLGLGAFLVFISECVSPRKAPVRKNYKKEDTPAEEPKENKASSETKPRRRTRKAE